MSSNKTGRYSRTEMSLANILFPSVQFSLFWFSFNLPFSTSPSSLFRSVSRLRRKKLVLSVNPPTTEDASSTDNRYGMVHDRTLIAVYLVQNFHS